MTDGDPAKNWQVNESMLLLMVFWQQTSDFSSFPRSSTAALLCAVAVLHGLGCTGALALLPDTLAEEC